ncbi:MAG: cell filamentation protein Fic [Phycisphaerae bacterium]|nr:cell filamentation protein Fic [Phycisphaerae bacterium]MBM90856.1 cell filamentation protein Fic [Phycisphaerae bacterium]HCT46236.1 cell filamentation protein Fic [Phycisphaerales bacterium]|tara:strand:- start:124 stop:1233 length:1110 start_codon:yes stop_codon:yes gene_type:complete
MAPVQFHNDPLPPDTLNWEKLIPLIGPAHAALARYIGTLNGIPNPDVLLSPLITQEATLSSKIEGTQATMGEVLEYEADEDVVLDSEKRKDIDEILNYRKALRYATAELSRLPLSQRLLRDTHSVLMQGVRGQNKDPGNYRKVSNWIGPKGRPIEEARFVPPSSNRIPDLMSAWEKFLHSDFDDVLVQLAILHVEFEAIHPFLDGNGRLGRLLVPLFLVSKGIMSNPNFYISSMLEANRDAYYDSLLSVSRDGDWTNWCCFFLKTMTEQAQENERKAHSILNLYNEKKDWISDLTHSQYAIRALDWFFSTPIFRTTQFIRSCDIPEPTANRIIRLVRDNGLLVEVRKSSGRRAAILAFPQLISIADGRD